MTLEESIDHVADVLSRVRMDLNARSRGAVIVEGPRDKEVLARGLALAEGDIFPINGRVNVLRAASDLAGDRLGGVVCVADRDFDQTEGEWMELGAPIAFYDNADLEAMLAHLDPLDHFLRCFGSTEKLTGVGGTTELLRKAKAGLAPLTSLRVANVLARWGLDFASLPVDELIDRSSLQLRTERLVARLAASSTVPHGDIAAGTQAAIPNCPHTGQQLVRGKDLARALEVALRRLIGSLSKQQTADDFATKGLRLAVGRGDLQDTPFGRRLDDLRVTYCALGPVLAVPNTSGPRLR